MNDASGAGGLADELTAQLPELRGKLKAGAVLADLTWFRVGGPAEILYSPADEGDLSYFMAVLPAGSDEFRATFVELANDFLDRVDSFAFDQPRAINRLKSARARRRHWWGGDPAWPWLR